MTDDNNSDLILEAILSTHEQQLQTLRQRRSALLRIASFNLVLLSILVGLAGVTVQAQLPVGPLELSIPISLTMLSLVMAIVKYKDFGVHWGYALDREFAVEMSAIPSQNAFEELVGIYESAGKKNKSEISSIDSWIFRIIAVMCVSLGYLLVVIIASG
ncbi:hypothetical protein PM030_08075 [Halorubrum ezzemoulense]|uniref:hypothetical protein n=1 Tax=Halorubrum ezzemoulense TaxID=337243 RepID=UPI002330C8F0|nr:hypothetical protein [Halorubrum ezzemoulense]MDB2281831.1 hypothetical protein [Halorubrum ezzemoulense]